MKITKTIVLVAISLIIGTVVGYVFSHKSDIVTTVSPAGTTGTSGKYYSQTISLTSSSATTTSMYNNSGFDFAVRAVDVMCQSVGTSKTAYSGSGLATLNFKIATSSSSAVTGTVSDVNTNYMANINIGTSTVDSYNATTTEGVIAGTSKIWPNGTYSIISSNATNTASCAVGISVMPL